MPSPWAESVGRSLEEALELLAAAVSDCPDTRWTAPMWPVGEPAPGRQFLDAEWRPVTDPAQRNAMAERWMARWSTPWSVAWHTLEVLDYDLSGEFTPWEPRPPFRGHSHWRDLPALESPWPRPDILAYIGYCRRRTTETFSALTDELAARPLPPTHRKPALPHARILVGLVAHTAEHAAQLRQFRAGAHTYQ